MAARSSAQVAATGAMLYKRGDRLTTVGPYVYRAAGWEGIADLGTMLLARGAAWEKGTCETHGDAMGSEGSCLACNRPLRKG